MDIWLRQETVDFLCGLNIDKKIALTCPGKYILTKAGDELARLLANTRLELPDEVEYLISKEASRDIQSKKKQIDLQRLFDHEIRAFDRVFIERALIEGPLFDQKYATFHFEE